MSDLDLAPGQPKGSETILSEEMWETILMNLTEASDVLNAGKTCVQFQRILHSKMIEANLTKTLPFLMDYMDEKSVLKCRSVSQGWRGIVDNFFEDYFLERTILKPDKELESFPATLENRALYPFGTRQKNGDHERFMREMKDHPRNPFVGRAVYFQLRADRETKEYFRIVYNFFEMFGKHIWTLEIEMSMTGGFPIEVERERIFPFIIRDVFELAPNLKNFYIKSAPSPGAVSMSTNEIRAFGPPPALDKLETSHAFFDYQDCKVEKAILLRHSNSQLSALYIKTLDALLRNLNWPNLKELHFTQIERISKFYVILRKLRLPKLELLSIALGEEMWYYEEWRRREQKKAFMKLFLALPHLCTSSTNLKTRKT